MGMSPLFEREDQVVLVPVELVLRNRILKRLPAYRVFQFKSRNRKAVLGEDGVEGVVVFFRIRTLSGDDEPGGPVVL